MIVSLQSALSHALNSLAAAAVLLSSPRGDYIGPPPLRSEDLHLANVEVGALFDVVSGACQPLIPTSSSAPALSLTWKPIIWAPLHSCLLRASSTSSSHPSSTNQAPSPPTPPLQQCKQASIIPLFTSLLSSRSARTSAGPAQPDSSKHRHHYGRTSSSSAVAAAGSSSPVRPRRRQESSPTGAGASGAYGTGLSGGIGGPAAMSWNAELESTMSGATACSSAEEGE